MIKLSNPFRHFWKEDEFQVTTAFGVVTVWLLILTAVSYGGTLGLAQIRRLPLDPTYLPWADRWLVFMQWLVPVVFGGVVLKRATSKADVIDAETRQALAVGSVPPPGPEKVP